MVLLRHKKSSKQAWPLQEDNSSTSAWLIGAYNHHDPKEEEIQPYREPPEDPPADRSSHKHHQHQHVILPCSKGLRVFLPDNCHRISGLPIDEMMAGDLPT